ncbi:MAG: efflux RND transporter permease subunit [Rikenellaceae bacterium]
MSLIEAAMRYNNITILAVVSFVVLGIYSLLTMPKQEFPDFVIRQGVVVALYPGASASEIEEQVARPLERYLFTFEEVDRDKSYSMSKSGILYVMVELNGDVNDCDKVWNKIKLGLQQFKMQLPSGVVALIANDDFGDTSALLISLESDQRSYRELEDYMGELQDRLFQIRSVSNVRSYGVQHEQISIYFDRAKIAGYGINKSALMGMLSSQGFTTTGGSVESAESNIPIHFKESYLSEQELSEQIVCTDNDGNTIRVKDIGRVAREYTEGEPFIENNAKRSVLLSLEMRSGFDIVQYGHEVESVLSDFQSTLPDDITIQRIADQPKVVEESVVSFIRDLFLAIVIVIGVMMILFPFSSAVVAGVTIPISIFITLLVMNILSIPLNTVTLAALIIVLGMIVDNSIIVIDTYLENLDRGYSRWYAAITSAQRYFGSILLATLCLCVIFFPLLFTMTGMMRDFVANFPLTLSIALLVSLVVAMLVIPFMEYKIIKVGLRQRKRAESKFNLLDIIQNGYNKLLNTTFRHPYITLACGVASIAASVVLYREIGLQLMPVADRDQFAVEIYLPEGSSVEQSEMVVDRLYDAIVEDERVTSITSFVGMSSPRFQTAYAPNLAGDNYAQMIVGTRSFRETIEVLDDYSEQYSDLCTGAYIRFKQLSYDPTAIPIEIRFQGDDIDALKYESDRLTSFMRGVEGITWVHTNFLEAQPTIEVELDSEAATRVGVNRALATTQLAMQYESIPAGEIWEGSYSLPIMLRVESDSLSRGIDAVGDQYISSILPNVVMPLRQIATVSAGWDEGQIVRRNGVRTLSVFADTKRGYLSKDVLPEIVEYIDRELEPTFTDGVSYHVGGYKEKEIETFESVINGLSISIILIFIFLLINFKRIKISLIALFALLLIGFGAVGSLYLYRLAFSFTSVMGIVSLMGIVVRNTIVMYEHADKLRIGEQKSAFEAAYDAGKRRMMPIFLTSATTAVGVIPMIASGSSLWKPVGIVVCYGTIWATLMVVTIMPIIYWLLYRGRDKELIANK